MGRDMGWMAFWCGAVLSTSVFAANPRIEVDSAPADIHLTKSDALKAAGLDVYETDENHRILAAIEPKLEDIKKYLGDDFGGTWIEYDRKKRVRQVIAVAGDLKNARKNPLFAIDGLVLIKVKYRHSELRNIQTKIMELFLDLAQGKEPLIFNVAINEQRNRLLVRALPENFEVAKSTLQEAGFDMAIIHFEAQQGSLTFYGRGS